MAINLPSLVSQLVTPDLVERAAAATGIEPTLARRLVTAAIPAVLGAFAGEASSPGGAKAISELISNQDPGLFDTLAAGVASGDANALAHGAGLLAALLGEEGSTQLSGVLAQATGASRQAAAPITGLVGAAVIGALGSQPPEAWIDGPAVAGLLAGERQAIAAALPASLAAALADNGFLRGFQTAVNGAFRTTPPRSTLGPFTPAQPGSSTLGAPTAGTAPGRSTLDIKPAPSPELKHAPAPPPPRPSSGATTWLYLVIALLIVSGIAWYLFHERPRPAAPAGSGRIEVPSALILPA